MTDEKDAPSGRWRCPIQTHSRSTGWCSRSVAAQDPSNKKPPVGMLRLDPDVVERFKADGEGWQTRMNEALRKAAGLD